MRLNRPRKFEIVRQQKPNPLLSLLFGNKPREVIVDVIWDKSGRSKEEIKEHIRRHLNHDDRGDCDVREVL